MTENSLCLSMNSSANASNLDLPYNFIIWKSWKFLEKKKLSSWAVFILGFEKSGGSARTLWKNVRDFQKVWGIIR